MTQIYLCQIKNPLTLPHQGSSKNRFNQDSPPKVTCTWSSKKNFYLLDNFKMASLSKKSIRRLTPHLIRWRWTTKCLKPYLANVLKKILSLYLWKNHAHKKAWIKKKEGIMPRRCRETSQLIMEMIINNLTLVLMLHQTWISRITVFPQTKYQIHRNSQLQPFRILERGRTLQGFQEYQQHQ